jgi:protein phosphatase
MGTTATVAVLADRELVVGQVGDSRAYVFRHGVLSQVTRDQTLVALLLREGKLDADRVEDFPGGHIILQAVGSAPTVDVDVTSVALEDGDVLLLCSDGLSGPVPDAVISGILSRQEPVTALADALVAEANARGGPDNVTCVLARFTRA